MLGRLRKRDNYIGLIVLVAACVIGSLFSLREFADQSDRATREREQTVIENGFSAIIRETQAASVTNSVWDEAVVHLDNAFNAQWAKDNVGAYFEQNDNFQFSFVLDQFNVPQFAMFGADLAPLSKFDSLSPKMIRVLGSVRQQERIRQAKGTTPGETLRNPIQDSALMWVDDRLYIVTATLVQPDFGHAQIKKPRAPIVVTGREIDPTFLDAFSKRYLLTNLHLHYGDSQSEPGEAHAPIYDSNGKDIATLDWTPQTPGAALLHKFTPWVSASIAIMLALVVWLMLRARRETMRTRLAQQRTAFLAYHDQITTLPNRAALERDANRMLADRQNVALLCLELDRYHEVSDNHGILAGDELLKQASLRLAQACAGDARCYRLDGDEFAILMPLQNEDTFWSVFERILECFGAPYQLSIGEKRVGCRVGAAVSSEAVDACAEFLRRANLALYQAKRPGAPTLVRFDQKMDEEVRRKTQLKEDLRAALHDGGLYMVYQPQVHLNGEVVGFEALIRWTHESLGSISPSVFIPLAEEAGLIHEIGDFALRRAAHDSRAWNHLKVAVNVSGLQLQEPAFVEHVLSIVKSEGADLHDIEIELTEGVFLSNNSDMQSTMRRLHEAGFSLALDDFGTGYSSLSYLQNFPFDKIKIDRAFVQTLGISPKADALLAAIVRLALSLDMRVIAEGVETHDQWLRLMHAGCPKVQGYIASKPMRAEEVPAFLEAWADAHKAVPAPTERPTLTLAV